MLLRRRQQSGSPQGGQFIATPAADMTSSVPLRLTETIDLSNQPAKNRRRDEAKARDRAEKDAKRIARKTSLEGIKAWFAYRSASKNVKILEKSLSNCHPEDIVAITREYEQAIQSKQDAWHRVTHTRKMADVAAADARRAEMQNVYRWSETAEDLQ